MPNYNKKKCLDSKATHWNYTPEIKMFMHLQSAVCSAVQLFTLENGVSGYLNNSTKNKHAKCM
jgi:hypothetical protein